MKAASLTLVLGLWAGTHFGLAAEAIDDPRFAALSALIDRIEASPEIHRAACDAMLTTGVELGYWSAEDQRLALLSLDDVFHGEVFTHRMTPNGMVRRPVALPGPMTQAVRWSYLVAKLRPQAEPAPGPAEIFDWLQGRIRSLEEMRKLAGFALVEPALDAIESRWLTARTERELEPLSPLLDRLRGITMPPHFMQWSAADNSRHSSASPKSRPRIPPRSPAEATVALLIDYYSILTPPQPLLLPAPDAEFSTYATFRAIARVLRENGYRFLDRPAVAARLAALQARFRAEFLAAQTALDDAILQEAPTAEFAVALERLARFSTPGEPPRFPARDPRPRGFPGQFMPPAGLSRGGIDYRDLLSAPDAFKLPGTSAYDRSGVPPAPVVAAWLRRAGLPPPHGDYAAWLALRTAEDSGSEADRAAATARLRQSLYEFRPAVVRHVQDRLGQPTPVNPPKAAPGWTLSPEQAAANDPVAALLRALESLAAHEKNAEIRRLAAAWRTLPAGDVSVDPGRAQDFAMLWSRILARPGGVALAELRARALRALLDPVGGDAVEPESLLRARLEDAIRRSDFAGTARLLALDDAGAALTSAERMSYRSDVDLLREATLPDAEVARAACLQLIRTASPRAAAEVAARRLKALR